MMSWDYPLPSHVTIRRWTLRCGLYLLDYACSKTGEYIGVIDESIQIGREKILLLLGVKLADDRSHYAALTMDDVEVLGVEVQQSWTGEDISSFIADRLDKHPQMKLKYVISDRGSNLLKALSMLGIPAVSDCSHWMMNAVKSLFGNNEVLSKLSSQIGQFRNRYTLTDKGFLVPPTLRDKDRFLKIFTIVQWVDRIDGYWKKLSTEQRNILGFMQQSCSLIRALRQVKTLVAIASQILKSAGLSHSSQLLWNNRVVEYRKGKRLTSQAKSFIQSIDQYFEQHQQLIKVNQRLICCSDIIESTFAHYKNKGGTAIISADTLAITLYKQNLTTDFIVKAL